MQEKHEDNIRIKLEWPLFWRCGFDRHSEVITYNTTMNPMKKELYLQKGPRLKTVIRSRNFEEEYYKMFATDVPWEKHIVSRKKLTRDSIIPHAARGDYSSSIKITRPEESSHLTWRCARRPVKDMQSCFSINLGCTKMNWQQKQVCGWWDA